MILGDGLLVVDEERRLLPVDQVAVEERDGVQHLLLLPVCISLGPKPSSKRWAIRTTRRSIAFRRRSAPLA